MPVDTQHESMGLHLTQAQKCRDAAKGEDAVKLAGTRYLPKLSKQTEGDYNAYKTRAFFYEATGRTLDGLLGLVFRKDPAQENAPRVAEEWLEDLDLQGSNLFSFAKDALREVLQSGRFGVLVDFNRSLNRPYLAAYPTESVVNWREEIHEGERVLTRINLLEAYDEADEKDPWTVKKRKRIRELQLVDSDGNLWRPIPGDAIQPPRIYRVQVYKQKPGNDAEFEPDGEPFTPEKMGDQLDFIPFFSLGPDGLKLLPCEPPLLGVANMNFSHYRTAADIENGRHFGGLPTYWAVGFEEKDEFAVGTHEVWTAQNPDAKAGILEFTGEGLGALEKALDQKERLMAVLGARLLEEQKKAAEAAATVRLRQAGEQSVLAAVAGTVSDGLEAAIKTMFRWQNYDADKFALALNKDYFPEPMTPQELEALITSWQKGVISYETLYAKMEQGEMTREGVDAEAELKQIEEEKNARKEGEGDRTVGGPPGDSDEESEENGGTEEGDGGGTEGDVENG